MGNAKKNQRACPAAGRDISSAECGAGRISRFACPATCPFNPWRAEAYDEILAVHDRLDAKVYPRLVQDRAKHGLKVDPPTASAAVTQDYFIDQLFHLRDDAGCTFFQRWEAQGFAGLNNDERVLFQAHARMRVCAIEIRTVLDETRSEATDLFDSQASFFPIADRSLAQIAGRFTPYLAWMYELPHYRRMHGLAVEIPAVQGLGPADVVRAVAAHLGWSGGAEPLQSWLDHHYALCADALNAIPPVLWEKTLDQSNTTRTVCLYRLQADPDDFAHVMAQWPEAVPGDLDPEDQKRGFRQCWDWLESASRQIPLALVASGAQPLRASISLGDAEALLTIPMGRTAEEERAEFERRLGSRVVFVGERADELGRQTKVAKSVTPRQRELVPPALLRHAHRIDVMMSRVPVTPDIPATRGEWMRALARRWLDEPVPALNHLTPRQAATDPAHRPALLALVKERIRDADRQRHNDLSGDDGDFLSDEEDPVTLARALGLAELDVSAPRGLYDPPRIQLPPLPAAALTEKEIDQRLEILNINDPTASDDFMDRFYLEADAVCEALDLLRDGNEADWPALLDLLLGVAWFILFPRQPPAQITSGEALANAVHEALDRWYGHDENPTPEAIHDALDSIRQPVLLGVLQALIFSATSRELKKARLDMGVAVDMAIALRVMVDALDRIARPEA